MLNLAIGCQVDIRGKTCIQTQPGMSGHAVYGPYMYLDPGCYVVEFNLQTTEPHSHSGDEICATVDVVSDFGRMVYAQEHVPVSKLAARPTSIALAFETNAPGTFEFRVAVRGNIALLVENYCRICPLDSLSADFAALLDATRFPDPHVLPKPAFFLEHQTTLRRLYESGAQIKVEHNDTIVIIDGIAFFARASDDLRFIEEIFYRSVYNVLLGDPCCVIDIGMNIGLVALSFAAKDCVHEVFSFEPFRRTYARACDNIRLNPGFAGKITAMNVGLAGADEETTVYIADDSDSGSMSIRGSDRGIPEPIVVRNAATVLGPIIDAALAKGLSVIAKVDCEGSEFPIFEALAEAGMLSKISAFMVEWHRCLDGKNQRDLVQPLLRNGFVVFDQSGQTGNGFFYAARVKAASI